MTFLRILLLTSVLSGSFVARSQLILDRSVALECHEQALSKVLDLLAEQGGFYFSYSGTLLNKDSLVTLPMQRKTVRETLDLLFKGKLQYRENGRYLILLPAPEKKRWPVILSVSKSADDDTIRITLPPKAILLPPYDLLSGELINVEMEDDSALLSTQGNRKLVPEVELTVFGKYLLSYHLRMQSLKHRKYFVQRPVQVSLTPGLSTNGRLNSQATNKVSLNAIGGYSAGVDGVELGGVFNIDRRKVTGLQAAGVMNVVGHTVNGVQLAGVINEDLDTIKGVQAAGVVNVARCLKGLQLGLVNIADTSEGCSIGLINIVRHGMHELSAYADEWSPFNLALRTGTPACYSILFAGVNTNADRRSYYFGYGLGHQFPLGPKLGLRTEVSYLHVSPGGLHYFDRNTFVSRFNLDLHWQATKQLGISAGPSFAFYNPDQNYYVGGQLYYPLSHGYTTYTISGRMIGWIGWRTSVDLF